MGDHGTVKERPSLYGRRWRKHRIAHLRAHPLCVMCLPRPVAATVVDHIKRHAGHGDPLFWDPGNWQSLCKPCHDSVKQQQDRKGFARGHDELGLPLYPKK
jgi:5-methylcytosine-specific restriction enzyme A